MNQPERALPLLARALAIADSSYEQDHPILVSILSVYAGALKKAGMKKEAKSLADRAATIDARRRAKVGLADLCPKR